VLCVAFAYLMWEGRGNSFYFDEWYWIEALRTGLHAIVAAYNQHLLAVPIAIYQLLFRLVGLDHYWVFRLLQTCAHLALAGVVFTYARRRIGVVALPLVLPLVFLGSGWEYVLEPVNVGFVSSIALGVGALLVLEGDGRRREVLAFTMLVVGIACSEFAVVFAIAVAIEALWRKPRLRSAWVWAIPLTLYGAWWITYHQPSMARHNLAAAPAFAAQLAASAAGGLVGLETRWRWALLGAVTLIVFVRVRRYGSVTPRQGALLAAALLFWLIVALGRAQLGDATAPRYVYTGVVFILLVVAESLRGVRVRPVGLVLASVVSVVALVGNLEAMSSGEAFLHDVDATVRAELAALELARPLAPPQFHVDLARAPVVVAYYYFQATDSLRSSPSDSLSELPAQTEAIRSRVDGVLLRLGELRVAGSITSTGGRSARSSSADGRRCAVVHHGGPGQGIELTVPPKGIELEANAGPPARLRARRFATRLQSAPFATLPGGSTVTIRAYRDRASPPWRIEVQRGPEIRACILGS
jgi:hypothetical protein